LIRFDPHLLVRAGAIYIATLAMVALWVWRRPSRRFIAGAMLAAAWNVPVVLGLHLLALRWGWWNFDAQGGLFLGMPVDLFAAWVALWSIVPAFAFPASHPFVPAAFALALDLVLMPIAAPVIQLGPYWLVGEALGVLVGVLPGQLLARWTAGDSHVRARAALQALAFSGLLLFVLPAIAIEGSGSPWINPSARPNWQLSLIVQLLAGVGLLGLTAVQEFAERGRGTPVPFDPPKTIVTTGIYSYVRNPMQLSAVLLLLILGAVLANWWVAASALVAHVYSAGLAGWDEDQDLRDRFGEHRVRDTPISEPSFVGAGVGAAVAGLRPVVEIQIWDFIAMTMDQVVNQAAKFRYMLGGTPTVPLVIRGPQGGGIRLAAQHSQSLEAWFTHVPGLVVIAPSTPYDAKGLLTAAIRDDNPVIFLEHKALYALKGEVPEEPYAIPIGKADVKRAGRDVTVIATQAMVARALQAAGDLEKEGVSVEVIDPRTLAPLDEDAILNSVGKTHRLVIAHEAVKRGGFGAEVAAMVSEKALDELDAPIARVAARTVPMPYNDNLERATIPTKEDIVAAIKSLLG